MKKIILIFVFFGLISSCAFCIRAVTPEEDARFIKSLNLSKAQEEKIKQIEEKAYEKSKPLYEESDRQRKLYNNCITGYICKEYMDNIRTIEDKLYKIDLEKEASIIRVLNIFQKERYKEYKSRVY